MDRETRRLAVLIDAENAQVAILSELLAEIAKLGSATVRRIYGDFTNSALTSWREPLLSHSIQAVQQYRNTVHKNASDSALIIDAMDLLHSGRFDGFCIVSSDSDFTRLASRIREDGLLVYGFGEHNTPASFIAACDKFTYTKGLRSPGEQPQLNVAAPKDLFGDDIPLRKQLVDAVESCADESGWAPLGAVGKVVANHVPDFDPRHYGFKKLSSLVEAIDIFELKRSGDQDASSIFVTLKPGVDTTNGGAATNIRVKSITHSNLVEAVT
jgi:hypothetical protein